MAAVFSEIRLGSRWHLYCLHSSSCTTDGGQLFFSDRVSPIAKPRGPDSHPAGRRRTRKNSQFFFSILSIGCLQHHIPNKKTILVHLPRASRRHLPRHPKSLMHQFLLPLMPFFFLGADTWAGAGAAAAAAAAEPVLFPLVGGGWWKETLVAIIWLDARSAVKVTCSLFLWPD